MEKLKSILLPLALVFAAVAVFELGARYGSTNMRAFGTASEMALPLNLYLQNEGGMDVSAREELALMIDRRIASAAELRETWYLNDAAERALDEILAKAFAVRGEAVLASFEPTEAELERLREARGEAGADEAKARLAEIRSTIGRVREELAEAIAEERDTGLAAERGEAGATAAD